jgi:hypothetical protein
LNWTNCGPYTLKCERGTNSFNPQFSISRVPEPGTLWLSGLALVALLTGARRRAIKS